MSCCKSMVISRPRKSPANVHLKHASEVLKGQPLCWVDLLLCQVGKVIGDLQQKGLHLQKDNFVTGRK